MDRLSFYLYHELPEEVKEVTKLFTDEPIRQTWRLKIGKAGIDFHHEVGFSGGFTKTASAEKEITLSHLAQVVDNYPESHIHIRSHCHYFAAVHKKKHVTIITPCLQVQNSYGMKSSPTKNIPDLGMLYLEVDDSRLEKGMCPCYFEEMLFPHPIPEVKVHETSS